MPSFSSNGAGDEEVVHSYSNSRPGSEHIDDANIHSEIEAAVAAAIHAVV